MPHFFQPSGWVSVWLIINFTFHLSLVISAHFSTFGESENKTVSQVVKNFKSIRLYGQIAKGPDISPGQLNIRKNWD